MKMKNRWHEQDIIDLALDMDTNVVNIKPVSVWWCYIYIKQYVGDIWSSSHQKVKQRWG